MDPLRKYLADLEALGIELLPIGGTAPGEE